VPAASQPVTAQPQASGQIICSQSGCRPLARGCKVVNANEPGAKFVGSGQFEVCKN
jgi:hypothetical protein